GPPTSAAIRARPAQGRPLPRPRWKTHPLRSPTRPSASPCPTPTSSSSSRPSAACAPSPRASPLPRRSPSQTSSARTSPPCGPAWQLGTTRASSASPGSRRRSGASTRARLRRPKPLAVDWRRPAGSRRPRPAIGHDALVDLAKKHFTNLPTSSLLHPPGRLRLACADQVCRRRGPHPRRHHAHLQPRHRRRASRASAGSRPTTSPCSSSSPSTSEVSWSAPIRTQAPPPPPPQQQPGSRNSTALGLTRSLSCSRCMSSVPSTKLCRHLATCHSRSAATATCWRIMLRAAAQLLTTFVPSATPSAQTSLAPTSTPLQQASSSVSRNCFSVPLKLLATWRLSTSSLSTEARADSASSRSKTLRVAWTGAHVTQFASRSPCLSAVFAPALVFLSTASFLIIWDEAGEEVIRDLDWSRFWMKLRVGSGEAENDVFAEFQANTKDVLKRALNKPAEFPLEHTNGSGKSYVTLVCK
ncbi:Tricalbin-2, partial [Tilletia horrida]